MSYNDVSDAPFFGGLFGWRKKHEPKLPERANQPRPAATTNTNRIVCFRIDGSLGPCGANHVPPGRTLFEMRSSGFSSRTVKSVYGKRIRRSAGTKERSSRAEKS
jgi:hypothetical protein